MIRDWGAEEYIAMLVFSTFAFSIIIGQIWGVAIPTVLSDIVKTLVGFMFGRKYTTAKEKMKNGNG